MELITIAIAEDQALFRAGLIAILKNTHRIQPIFEAENGKELIEKLKERQPHVILLDLEMPVMDGVEAAKHIRKHYPDVRILVLSNHDEDAFIVNMIEIGANGYLLKDAEPKEMEEAIRGVVANKYYFNDRVSQAMVRRLIVKHHIEPTFNQKDDLNEREIEVLRLICQELNSQEIADIILISKRTVEGIRQNLLDKTGAKNTAGLVMFANKHGYVSA